MVLALAGSPLWLLGPAALADEGVRWSSAPGVFRWLFLAWTIAVALGLVVEARRDDTWGSWRAAARATAGAAAAAAAGGVCLGVTLVFADRIVADTLEEYDFLENYLLAVIATVAAVAAGAAVLADLAGDRLAPALPQAPRLPIRAERDELRRIAKKAVAHANAGRPLSLTAAERNLVGPTVGVPTDEDVRRAATGGETI